MWILIFKDIKLVVVLKIFIFERSHPTSLTRILVFMTYLNDVEDGITEFYYQKLKTKKSKRFNINLAIFSFTHTHKGVVSKTKEKYIVTVWFTLTISEMRIKL